MCRVQEYRLEGDSPVAFEPGLLTPIATPGWSARIRSLEVDGVRADYVEYDPYRFEVPALADRAGGPIRMMLVVMLAGVSTGRVDGIPLTVAARHAVLIDGRASLSFEAVQPIRAVRLFVDEALLPAEALRQMTRPFAELKDSPLVNGVVGLISGLLQVSSPTIDPRDAPAVSQPLIALQASLLDEALHRQHDDAPPGNPVRRRGRIEAQIDAHLADRALSVSTVAAALGVSVRTVHAAYADSDDTVAAIIRSRRVAKAQSLLAQRRERPNVAAVADRVGLTRDQLGKAFRETTGRSVTEWWNEHRPA